MEWVKVKIDIKICINLINFFIQLLGFIIKHYPSQISQLISIFLFFSNSFEKMSYQCRYMLNELLISSTLGWPIAPSHDSSEEVDGIEALLLEGDASSITTGSTPAVHQVGIFLLEVSKPHLDIRKRHMDGVRQAGCLPLSFRAYIHNDELRIVFVLMNQLFGLSCVQGHLSKIILSSGKSQNINKLRALQLQQYIEDKKILGFFTEVRICQLLWTQFAYKVSLQALRASKNF